MNIYEVYHIHIHRVMSVNATADSVIQLRGNNDQ